MSTEIEKQPRVAIADDQTYLLDDFKIISRLGDWGLRKAVRAGLKIRRCGRRAYVRGRDFSEFLANEAK